MKFLTSLFHHLWLFHHLMFSGTLFFAAGAPALTDASPAEGGDSAPVVDDGAADLGYGDDVAADEPVEAAEKPLTEAPKEEQQKDDPDSLEFRGAASRRLRTLIKEAPELASILQKYPKLQQEVEARFRRDFAYREIYPTIAEARQMRENFPNGLQDVQQLMGDVQEVEALDKDFYTRDRDGNYSGHSNIINNMFTDDREAAVSLFKTLPKEWARLDPQSYNEVMGQIVGATLAQKGIPEYISDLISTAKEAKNPALAEGLSKLLNWAEGFTREKPKPTADEERFQGERAAFKREKQTRDEEQEQGFRRSLNSEAQKVQLAAIKNQSAMKRLENVRGISPEKRDKLIAEVHEKIRQQLTKSPVLNRKLKAAYDKRDLHAVVDLHRAAWSQPWLLNKMVREVLRVETPAMVSSNREAAARRAGSQATKIPVKTGVQAKGPQQVDGRWYRGDGTPFTTAEVVAGKHQQ